MATYLSANFDSLADGADLGTYTPETGSQFARGAGYATETLLATGGRIRAGSTGAAACAYTSATEPQADIDIDFDVRIVTNNNVGDFSGVVARFPDSGTRDYLVCYLYCDGTGTGLLIIDYFDNNAFSTRIGSFAVSGLTNNTTYHVTWTLRANGGSTDHKAYWNGSGSPNISQTSSAGPQSPARTGVLCRTSTATTGIHVDNLVAQTVGGDSTPPTLSSAAVPSAGTTLTATLSESGCTPTSGSGGFTLAGTSATVASWAISGTTLTLTLSGTVLQGETVTYSYSRAATSNDIADAASNFLADFSGASVTNNSTQTAPLSAGTASFVSSGAGGIAVTATAPSGGSGSLSYQWERNVNGGSYSDLSGATSLSLTDSTASAGTLYGYRCKQTRGVDTVTTNAVTAQIYTGGALTGGVPGFASPLIRGMGDDMDVRLAETVTFDFITNSSTGAAADADSTPTAEVFEDATDTTVVALTVTKRTSKTGNYRVPVACTTGNGFEVGKSYSVIASATVGGVACKARVGSFVLRPAAAVANTTQIAGIDVTTSDGTAQAGAASTITLAGSSVATDDYYVPRRITLVGGTGAGQSRIITGYVGSTRVATVDSPWITVPDNTTTYQFGDSAAAQGGIDASVAGTVSDGAPAVDDFTAAAGLSTANDFYNGSLLVFTSGALKGVARRITDYVGSTTRRFTFAVPFPAAPTDADRFRILGRIDQ